MTIKKNVILVNFLYNFLKLKTAKWTTYLLVDDLWWRYPEELDESDDELEYCLWLLLDFLWCLWDLLSDIDLERDLSWLNSKNQKVSENEK